MTRTGFVIALLVLLTPWACFGHEGTGLGIIVGEPTGLSLKNWINGSSALDAGVAWSFVDEGSVHLHGDYLHHNFGLFGVDSGALPLYYGIGLRVLADDNDARLGIRIPVGLAYIFSGSRADIFAELAPLLDLSPETDFRLNGAAGIRYFFR